MPTAAGSAACCKLVLSGDAAQALADLDEAHDLGIDPSALLRGLMEELHVATRVKAGAGPDATDSAEQRQAAETLAGQLSWALIHRLWQMLLKALTDVTIAPDPQEAAAMGLLRLIHAADLPDPAALLTRLSGDGTAPARTPGAPAASAPSAPAAQLPGDFRGLLALLEREGKHQLAVQLHDQVGLVRYAPPELSLKPLRPLGSDWSRDLAATLKSVTGDELANRAVRRPGRAVASGAGQDCRGTGSLRSAFRPRACGR